MEELTKDPSVRALLGDDGPRHLAFIDGEYVAAVSGETFDCVSPISGEAVAEIASCAAADVDRAVRGARAAFDGGTWARGTPRDRKRCSSGWPG